MEWLHSGEGVYWISGKAGCGKSTLMKFLCRNPETSQALPTNLSNICVAGFFFHDRGYDPLLKSQEGLFRAILHRILSSYRQLISVVLPVQFKRIKASLADGKDRFRYGGWQWLLSELKSAFRVIVTQKVLSLQLCLLIDGLDEFSGEHKDIIAVLNELVRPSDSPMVRVQLCLSSRPLLAFENAYSEYPHLKVQDLTVADIKRYVIDQFNNDPQLKYLASTDHMTSDQIIDEILEKAEGVSTLSLKSSFTSSRKLRSLDEISRCVLVNRVRDLYQVANSLMCNFRFFCGLHL